MSAVDRSVALAYVRLYLSGLREYPLHEDGQKCLAMHLANYSVSVEHAESILQAFRGVCPAPQDLHDVAYNENLRAKFAPPTISKVEQWKKECGAADPAWSQNLLKAVPSTGNKRQDIKAQLLAMRYQSIRDSLYYMEGGGRGQGDRGFWQTAMDGHKKNRPELVAFFRAAIADGRLDAVPPVPEYDATKKVHSFTQAEYEAMSPAVPEAPAVRCVECGGSGRLAGDDYCRCRTGKDLRRAES